MPRWNILITAGPTREPLDPVRFLSNRSSGKMGYALAEAARNAGHRVTLISGPVSLPPPRRIRLLRVETAREMLRATLKEARRARIIIMAAAVADYEPLVVSRQKIKKNSGGLYLRLKKTTDILAELGRRRTRGQLLVGFAAETTQLLRHARVKLESKGADYIVANRVGKRGMGFESDYNAVTILGRDGSSHSLKRMSKKRLAGQLMKFLLSQRPER